MVNFSLGLVAAFSLILVRYATAEGCFDYEGQKGDCSKAFADICGKVENHTFSNNEEVSSCVDVDGYRCNMKVVNTGSGGAQMGKQACLDDMSATNTGCWGYGGIRVDGNFELTLDPNSGAC